MWLQEITLLRIPPAPRLLVPDPIVQHSSPRISQGLLCGRQRSLFGPVGRFHPQKPEGYRCDLQQDESVFILRIWSVKRNAEEMGDTENMTQRTLDTLCPDFPEWPERWMGLEEDFIYGEELLEVMRPFAEFLVNSKLADKTVKSHFDNLWLLGGEIIREVSIDKEYAKPPRTKLHDAVGPDGGPLCRHLHTEAEKSAFDATCRKLYKHLSCL